MPKLLVAGEMGNRSAQVFEGFCTGNEKGRSGFVATQKTSVNITPDYPK